jgi:mRNA interferase MazF
MNVQRGDVVLIDYPYTRGGGSKVRPALVIQNDRDNYRVANTIIAQITGNVLRATTEPTQLLVDLQTP